MREHCTGKTRFDRALAADPAGYETALALTYRAPVPGFTAAAVAIAFFEDLHLAAMRVEHRALITITVGSRLCYKHGRDLDRFCRFLAAVEPFTAEHGHCMINRDASDVEYGEGNMLGKDAHLVRCTRRFVRGRPDRRAALGAFGFDWGKSHDDIWRRSRYSHAQPLLRNLVTFGATYRRWPDLCRKRGSFEY